MRGTSNSDSSYMRKPRSGKRKTLDTDDEIDQFLEDYRKKWFKDVPSRQKAVFAVPTKGTKADNLKSTQASDYGNNLVVIMFKNGFKLFQSGNTKDFTGSKSHDAIQDYLLNLQYFEKDYDIKYNPKKMLSFAQFKKLDNYKYYSDDKNQDFYSYYKDEHGNIEKALKELEKQVDSYFTTGVVELKGVKETKGEVIIEHKGYWAFNVDIIKEYCYLEKITPAKMMSQPELKKIKKYLAAK